MTISEEALKDATDVDQIIDIFKSKRRNRSMYLVAVCSCPVGIAHTYMAAANLKKAAQKKESKSRLRRRSTGSRRRDYSRRYCKM